MAQSVKKMQSDLRLMVTMMEEQEFGTRISSMEKTAEDMKSQMEKNLSTLDRLEQLLKQRWIERGKTKGIQIDETQSLEEIASLVEGSLKLSDPSKELIQTILPEKNDLPTQGMESSDPSQEPTRLTAKPEEKKDRSIRSPQMVTQVKYKPQTQRTEIPIFLLDGENKGRKVRQVEQYFERGKFTEQKLFGFDNTKRKAVHQQEEEKQTEAVMEKYACQVLDEMPLSEKKVTKKRKRKRWKYTANANSKSYGRRSERGRKIEGAVLKNMRQWLNLHVLGCEKVNKGTWVQMKIDSHQMMDKNLLTSVTNQKKKSKKQTFIEYVRWKHEKSNSETLGIQIGNIFGSKRSWAEWCKGVRCLVFYTHQMINKRWLLRFIKKKKGRTKVECDKKSIEFVNAKLLMEDKTVKKKPAKWKKHKAIQKHKFRYKYRNMRSPWKQVAFPMNFIPKLKYSEMHPWEWCKEKHQRYQRAYGINALIYLTMVIGLMKVEKKQYLTSRKRAKFRKRYMRRGMKNEYMSARLRGGYKSVLKKLAKRIKHKFKQKHNMRWAKTKLGVLEMMLASQMEKSTRTKWKKRKTKHQYQYKHKSKVKGRSLTNQFLTRMDSGVGVIIGQRAVSSPAEGWKVKGMDGYPLVDLKSLIRLLPFAQPLGKGLLQSLLLILGVHNVTKSTLVQLLLDKIRPAMEASPSELEISHPQRLYGCQSNVVNGLSQLLNGLPPLLFCRVLEVWTYRAVNHLTVADMLFYFEWSLLSQLPKPKPCGGKGEERVTHETNFWNLEISRVVFLKLLNLPLFAQSTSRLAPFMGLLQVVVYTAAVRIGGWYHSSGVPEKSKKEPVGEKASREIGEDAESELVHEADELSVARSKNCADIYNIFMQLPQPDLYNLCIIICASLPTLNHTQKMNHTTGSTAGVSLLCVLQVLCLLSPAIDDSTAGTEKEREQEEALTKGEGLSKFKYSWKWKNVIYNLEDKVEFKGASNDT